jgi:hypothetical protein
MANFKGRTNTSIDNMSKPENKQEWKTYGSVLFCIQNIPYKAIIIEEVRKK